MHAKIKSAFITILIYSSMVLCSSVFADNKPDINTDSRIVYAHGSHQHSNLFSIKPDGSGMTQLTDHKSKNWEPEWSPDGKSIAFTRTVTAITKYSL